VIITSRNKELLRSSLAIVLLACYFLVSGPFRLLHESVHHHHQELHSEMQEADGCHRAIYHGEIDNSCTHKSHIHAVEAECSSCKASVSRYFFHQEWQHVVATLTPHGALDCSVFSEKTEPYRSDNSLRGPPTKS
jgi:hypothetical protein